MTVITLHTAYTFLHLRRWWITIATPSGAGVRLFTSYPSRADAERAIVTYGYVLRVRPFYTRPYGGGASQYDNDDI